MHHVEIDAGVGMNPAVGEFEHPAPADCVELVPVADQRDPATASSAIVSRARAVS
jgi:hypothetical protein